MKIEKIVKPCRNFCFLGSELITDPRDGKEKFVLSTFAGEGGSLVFIDTETGEGESISLPADSGAWALYNYNNERLLVGTCASYGYLHCLELKTRTWLKSLRCEGETYIWNLTMGSDGNIYGGTYPGCVLLRYDPRRHELVNLGKADNGKNLYSRYVFGDCGGKILVNCVFAESGVNCWDIDKEEFSKVFGDGETILRIKNNTIYTQRNNEKYFYDAGTFEPVDMPEEDEKPNPLLPGESGHIKALGDGRIIGIKGQEYFIIDHGTISYKRIPVSPPATEIFTVTGDGKGKIWGSSGFGQTIFSYDPDNGEAWNSLTVTDIGGEVYGMRFIDGLLYLSAYSGGDHVVYDPSKEWNQRGNVNPKTLESVSPKLIRPNGGSAVGPDGAFWTGWMAGYGAYGGGISRIDPATHEMTCWHDPVEGQAISSIEADERYIYFVTCGEANGLPYKEGRFSLCVWNGSREEIKRITFGEGKRPSLWLQLRIAHLCALP